MKTKLDVYNFKQLEAITNILARSEQYFHRKVCRWFSEKYSTPLHQVEEMSWDYLLTHYYESTLEQMDYNEVYDMAQNQYIKEFIEDDVRIREELEEELVREQEELLAKKAEKNKVQGEPKSVSMSFDDEDFDE